MRLKDKVVFITGGGMGIGRSCVELFAREGANVVIAERDEASGQAVHEALEKAGLSSLFIPTDVSDADSVNLAIEKTIDQFGRIDVLYNNVGGSTLNDGPVAEAPFDEFWHKMQVDVFGTWLCSHYAIPHMIAAGGGSIINATSVCGIIGTEGRDAYTAAKGAISALTRSMAVEYAKHNIRVNAIAPGATTTERVVKRMEEGSRTTKSTFKDRHLLGMVEPIDVAYAILYLASDESRRTTGHIMVVDSGLTVC